MNLTIKDETVLPGDLRKSLIKLIKALHKKDKKPYPGWKTGYVMGYTQSHLNSHWIFEYIRKQEKAYKQITMLQALRDYLQFDTQAKHRVKKVYQYLLESESNLACPAPQIDTTYESMVADLISGEISSEKDTVVDVFFKNIITRMVDKFIQQEIPEYLPDLEIVFTVEEISELLKVNGFKKL